MLDTDPTDPTTSGPDGDAGTTDPVTELTNAPASSTAAPRKRAPRKAAAKKVAPAVESADAADVPTDAPSSQSPAEPAPTPRKRAPRKAAAKATPPKTPVADAPPAEPAPDAAAEAPPARPARKRAAKKAAPAAAVDLPAAAEPTTEPTAEAARTEPAEAEITAEPVRTRPARKRAAKKSAAPADAASPAEPDAADTSAGTAEAAPAMAAPGVLFIAPTAEPDAEAKPTRRRRAAKKSAPAVDPEATDETPVDATATSDSTLAAAAAEDAAAAENDAAAEDNAETGADDAETADPEDVREAAIEQASGARRRRRRGRRGRGGASRADSSDESDDTDTDDDPAGSATDDSGDSDSDSDAGTDSEDGEGDEQGGTASRRRRRRRRSSNSDGDGGTDDPPNTVVHVREPKKARDAKDDGDDGVRGVKGSTRLEAKRQRRRDGRETTRRRAPILTESEFLARREAVDRVMAVRQAGDRTQIAVLEDDILVEHYVTRASATSYVGNVYLGRVQNVLPSMEAAFIDIGKGRNGVLYAGEVNWDAAGLEGKSRAIEHAMKSGDPVLVQVSKDPVGHKGARLTSQISLPGRFLVLVPGGGMTGISRRLPDTERHRLKAILKKIVPEDAGVIVRTAAEGASEEDLTRDVERLVGQWEQITEKAKNLKSAPSLVHGEPDLAIRVVRDVFNEDFKSLVVDGDDAWATISEYLGGVAPDLAQRASRHTADTDLFHDLRVDEQLAKALDRKVYLPSGGSLVIDRTEAMTVVDVNTGKYVGSGGNLEQTVTRNNLEAAEEIVRQLRLRDVGGIVVIDFIDMVLESNRELVLRRLTECLGRDRTKHQVAEVTSLGLVQMTRKRVGEGLLEAFSENCEHCHGRGILVHTEPVDKSNGGGGGNGGGSDDDRQQGKSRRKRGGRTPEPAAVETVEPPATDEQRQAAVAAIAAIHRAAEGEKPDSGDGRVDELATGLFEAVLEAERPSGPSGRAAEPVTGTPAEAPAPAAEASGPAAEASGPATTAASAVNGSGPNGSAPAIEDAPAARPRRQRRVATRPAGGPAASEPAVVVLDTPLTTPDGDLADTALSPERVADEDERSAAQPAPDAVAQPADGSGDEPAADAPAATAPARPRRRRAASRPAGPPSV